MVYKKQAMSRARGNKNTARSGISAGQGEGGGKRVSLRQERAPEGQKARFAPALSRARGEKARFARALARARGKDERNASRSGSRVRPKGKKRASFRH